MEKKYELNAEELEKVAGGIEEYELDQELRWAMQDAFLDRYHYLADVPKVSGDTFTTADGTCTLTLLSVTHAKSPNTYDFTFAFTCPAGSGTVFYSQRFLR